jgi:hypothetical protein
MALAEEISRGLSIISDGLGNTLNLYKPDAKKSSLLVILDRLLPSQFLHFIGSSRWSTLIDNATLNLGLPKSARSFDSRWEMSRYSFFSWFILDSWA